MASPMPDDIDFTPMTKEELEVSRKEYETRSNRFTSLDKAITLEANRAGLTEDSDQVVARVIANAKKFEAYLNGNE